MLEFSVSMCVSSLNLYLFLDRYQKLEVERRKCLVEFQFGKITANIFSQEIKSDCL